MNEDERLQLIDTLIQKTIQHKGLCTSHLSAEDKIMLQQTPWHSYNYMDDDPPTSLSVHKYIYKVYYELCIGTTVLTSASPYYSKLRTSAVKMVEVIKNEKIPLEKLPYASTNLTAVTEMAHTHLSYFTSGNLSSFLKELAKQIFL